MFAAFNNHKLGFNCTFDEFKEKVESDRNVWGQYVEKWNIAKVDEHKSIMVMKVLDFEALEAFMATDEMVAWDKENGCVDILYSMDALKQIQ